MEEKKVGVVTHYFGHLNVVIIDLTEEGLNIGDAVHIKGHSSDFQQKVESMQIEHKDVEGAKKGDKVGLKVKEHARENDVVYKVIE